MRVLTVGNLYPPHDMGGGYEIVWHGAVEAMRAGGHDVRVLTTEHRIAGRGPDASDVHRELRWYWSDDTFPRRSVREALAIQRHNHSTLRRHLGTFRPDVVGWWSMGGMSLSLLEAARRAGVPAVAFVHDDWLDYGRRADGWLRRPRIARAADRLTGVPGEVDWAGAAHYAFVSKAARDHAWMGGLPAPDRSVIPSGIDERFIDLAPPRAWDWSLLYVGRIDRRKGITTAVDALALLPEATLSVAGDGPDVPLVRDHARERGVSERVRLLGTQDADAISALYAAADAVVFPVEWQEPWGLVPLESMARGRPVVATGRGGSAEYLRDGENALLFPAGDATELAERLRRLAADSDLRDRLRATGLETARRHTAGAFNDAVEAALHVVKSRPTVHGGSDAFRRDKGELIFFPEDMSPELKAVHAEVHRSHPGLEHAVQGAVAVGRSAFGRWLARRGHPPLPAPRRGDVGPAYLDTRNLSIKRALLERSGGSPEPGCLGDLGFAYRLSDLGLRLHFEPRAQVRAPAPSLAAVLARMSDAARAERAFVGAHPHLEPTLRNRLAYAAARGRSRGRLAPLVAFIPEWVPWLGPRVWRSATDRYEQALAETFL